MTHMDVQQAMQQVSTTLTRCALPGHFERLDDDEIAEVFEELSDLGLEPSSALRGYFRDANPLHVEISPWIHGDLELVPLRGLVDAHEGYAYREAGRRRVEAWRGRWIIVAMSGDDPYLVDASVPALPVYTDAHGAGAWKPRLVASSLVGFLRILSHWVEHLVMTELVEEGEPEQAGDYARRYRARQAWKGLDALLLTHDPVARQAEFWSEVFDTDDRSA